MPVAADGTTRRSVFHVARMDCVGEERLVRLALEGEPGVQALQFDLPARRLAVTHDGEPAAILARLAPLALDARLVDSVPVAADAAAVASSPSMQARVLRQLLAINALMFLLELCVGWYAQSTGLIADSLDMFADAAVYGVALYAVGRAASLQRGAARLSGVLQVLLALGVLAEVARRAVYGSEPLSALMMGMGLLALVANVACMLLLAKQRDSGAHMRASWIFSTNDVLANLGVIVAGVLVAVTGSAYPDLVIGTLIGLLVLSGGVRILRLPA